MAFGLKDTQGRPFSFAEWGNVHHLYLKLRHGSENYTGKIDHDEFDLFYEAYQDWKAGRNPRPPALMQIQEKPLV